MVQGKKGVWGGGDIQSAILQITEQNEQPKEELLLMISHLLRCLDSAVYCWFPGKTAPMQSS